MRDLKYLKAIMSSLDKDIQKVAESLAAGSLTVDLYELESLVNSDSFEFPEEEIETVVVELDEEDN